MRRILIAGCGYVGQATADLFHAAGWAVEGWTQSAESAAKLAAKPYPVYGVDITDQARISTHAGVFDAIIHCASSGGGDADSYRQIYLNGARNLLIDLVDRECCLRAAPAFMRNVMVRGSPKKAKPNRRARPVEYCLRQNTRPRPWWHRRAACRDLRTRTLGAAEQISGRRSDH